MLKSALYDLCVLPHSTDIGHTVTINRQVWHLQGEQIVCFLTCYDKCGLFHSLELPKQIDVLFNK